MLRTELQYKGVVITDDLMMKAIDANYGLDEAAVLSLKAGSDIVMIAGGYEKVRDVLTALLDADVSGEIPEERIYKSVRRILLLKEKYEITDAPVEGIQTERLNNLLETLLKRYMN
ncbi:glycoside hydrolase family 3 N-terminal domain-containing protein [Proteiniclasticum sp. C24MP]|uniref:glycoside hydrolase family 3 N-terminal domain-containing protein n=1 Tax=Proteiniclasticum sp. C24MP TaxID=3374101 RepID=UPI00375436AB